MNNPVTQNHNKMPISPVLTYRGDCPPPRHNVYVEFTAERYPSLLYAGDSYLAPAQTTGERSGEYMRVLLWAKPPLHRHQWLQWVHIDDIHLKEDIEGTKGA